MSLSRALALLTAVSLSTLMACSGSEPGSATAARRAPAAGTADGDAVVAEVNGTTITRAELEEKAAAPLARVRQEEFEIHRRVLDDMIAEILIEAEASERGLSLDELLEQEVDRQAKAPSTATLEALYERHKDRFAGQPREEALERIAEALRGQSRAEGQARFERALREKAEVQVHLDPPRVAVAIPPGAPATGPAGAPITIVEFSDYQCPYCHRAQGVVEQILEEYSEQVRFVHLDFPLGNHTGAIPAARAARCAGEQDRFWDYHRSLMTERGPLDDADLKGRARKLRLDAGDFATCLASDRHDEAIMAELDHGSSLGVSGTPAYFINGRMVSGARPFSAFAEVIDAELEGL